MKCLSSSVLCLTLAAAAHFCGPSSSSLTDGPSLILQSLKPIVYDRSIIIDGVLQHSEDIDEWNVVVNDSVVFTVKGAQKGENIPIRVALGLRYGNNTVALYGLQKVAGNAMVTNKRWSTQVFVQSEQNPSRYAILVGDRSNTQVDADVSALRAQLIKSGIPSQNIKSASSREDIDNDIEWLRQQASSRDQILVYFRGDGIVSTSDGEPILRVNTRTETRDGWIPTNQLIRETGGLPPTSFVLDVGFQDKLRNPYIDESSENQPSPNRAIPEHRDLPWLHFLPRKETEIAVTNPFGPGPSGELTKLILFRISAALNDGCITLAEAIQAASTDRNSRPGSTPPVYFTTAGLHSSFCLSEPTTSPDALQVSVSRFPDPDQFMFTASVSATIPPAYSYSWRDIVVDGVIVRHTPNTELPRVNKLMELVPMTEGKHIVELRLGTGSKAIAAGRVTFIVPSIPVAVMSESNDLRAKILRPTTPNSITSSGVVTIGFMVADMKADSVRYELRNNGVVIVRGIAGGRQAGEHVEILRRVPVSVGENNIVVEVRDGNEAKFSRSLVIRRLEQPIRAVIVGVDAISGLAHLGGVQTDVEAMKQLLLNYSDLKPSDLVTISGTEATWNAVRDAIQNSHLSHSNDPMVQGAGDETFFLYFSGYGTTLTDDKKKPISRCILTADFDPNAEAKKCISTTDLDGMLDSWNSSIIVFDTSYDGLSGFSGPGPLKELLSRTYGDYLSPNLEWRTAAGTDRTDRVFLVASKTNTAALESSNPPGGLFTSSLVETVQERLPLTPSDPPSSLQLFDAFISARNKTIVKSGKAQIPLMKGALASPFYFKPRNIADLVAEAQAIDLGVLDDIQSLRRVDPNEIIKARTLYDTILAIRPDNFEALQGKVRLLIYQGEFDAADKLLLSNLDITKVAENAVQSSAWYFLRSILKMKRGDIQGALTDCESSLLANPKSVTATSLMAALQLAVGQYTKSAAIVEDLLNRTEVTGNPLTDDEWAHIVLIGYIAMRRSDRSADSSAWLKRYFGPFPAKSSFQGDVGHAVYWIPKSLFASSAPSPVISVQSPWFQKAAEFLLEPQADVTDLESFAEKNRALDPKNPQVTEFMIHFYKGMKFSFENSPDLARNELRLAIDSGEKQFVEYWIANGEFARISSQPRTN